MKPSVSYQEKPRKSATTSCPASSSSSSPISNTVSKQYQAEFLPNFNSDRSEYDRSRYLSSSDDRYKSIVKDRIGNGKSEDVTETISEEISDSLVMTVKHRRVSSPELNDPNEIRLIEENVRENERLWLSTEDNYDLDELMIFEIDDGDLADIEDN